MPVTTFEIEMRALRGTEVRASKGNGKFELTGRAASYNVPTKINSRAGAFMEVVGPSAFSRSLREGADVKATFNHDPNHILGRTKSGTLKLSSDSQGLNFRCILDPTNTDHQNIHASVSRGDHDQCSFAYKAKEGGIAWDTTTDPETGLTIPRCTLNDVDLVDIAPAVTYPAYGGDATNVSARAAAHVATTHRPPDAVLLIASDNARRSVARVIGKRLAADADKDLRARAKRLGAVIRADAEQARKDNEMLARAENYLGIIFGKRAKADVDDDDDDDTEADRGLASAVAKAFPGHKMLHADSQTAYTKANGMKYSIPYSQKSDGSLGFQQPRLGGHPAWLGAKAGFTAESDL